MLTHRAMTPDDLEEVRWLHDTYYSNLEFPRFREMMGAFIIEDEENEIVMAGGVEAVGEAFLVTNRAKSGIKLGKSLVLAQSISAYLCKRNRIKELLAFSHSPTYTRHLVQHGFTEREGQALSLELDNG